MNYINRNMEKAVLKASSQYPVVMVCGQRQAGKSTMLRHISEPDRVYVSFDRLITTAEKNQSSIIIGISTEKKSTSL